MIVSRGAMADTTRALERLREDVERHSSGVTVSIGMASAASDELNRERLQAQAMAALQEAKRRGRNRVLTFEEIEGSVSLLSSAKIQAVRRLLSQRHMAVAFQPIWNIATGTLLAFEALARPAADSGLTGPQEMFELVQRLKVQCAQGYLLGRPSETIPEARALQDLNQFLCTSSSEAGKEGERASANMTAGNAV